MDRSLDWLAHQTPHREIRLLEILTLIKRALEIETMGVRPSFSELILKT